MKIDEVVETMQAPDLSILTQRYVNANIDYWKNSSYIADIDQFQVKKLNDTYSVWNNNQLVATASLQNHIVDKVWVNPKYRGQKIFSKLLWFYKTRENISPLILGPIHSSNMQEVVKGLSRFRKYWSNGTEKHPFSVDTLDNFYSYESPTEWKLYLENSGDFQDWPRYTTGIDFIKEDYNWPID